MLVGCLQLLLPWLVGCLQLLLPWLVGLLACLLECVLLLPWLLLHGWVLARLLSWAVASPQLLELQLLLVPSARA